VFLLGGKNMESSTIILQILSITVPLNGISNYINIQVLTPYGYQSNYRRIVVFSLAFFSIMLILLFSFNKINLINLSSIAMFTELFAVSLGFSVIKKYKILKLI
jgi:hypothetical protein